MVIYLKEKCESGKIVIQSFNDEKLYNIDLEQFFKVTAPEYEVTECYFEHFDCRSFWTPKRDS